MKYYSIRKLRKIVKKQTKVYRKKEKKLDPTVRKSFEELFTAIYKALNDKNKEQANLLFQKLEQHCEEHLKQSSFEKGVDVVVGIAIALVIAVLIRQMWFEFYIIPTGSMRPTFKEKDYVAVSKTDFSLNVPLQNKYFYFDPDLLKRGNIFIFNGAGLDIPDVNTRYFFLFPGKKQYVKRLIGKPGDTLYFYGGQIYGIDKDKQPIQEFDHPLFEKIEHIPFIHFSGKVYAQNILPNGIFSPIFLYQMNQNVAKMEVSLFGKLQGEVTYSPSVQKYSDLWGIKNFAMARLVSNAELNDCAPMAQTPLYLELKHHPKLDPLLLAKDEYQRLRPSLSYEYSYIPLNETSLRKIFNHMTTARFVIKNKKAYRYGYKKTSFSLDIDAPDGVYEFDNGVLYKVYLDSFFISVPSTLKTVLDFLPVGGFLKKMPENHPLYTFSVDRVKLLYNLGIEFDTRFSSEKKHLFLDPSRYAYFKKKNLYLLGHPILSEQELETYTSSELSKENSSLSYEPFIDLGPPLINGELDVDFIEKYGVKVPENRYLALGDNHAMSADSRDFGFVPESNLKGGAEYIFWPINRIGSPLQPAYPVVNLPKIIVWTSFIGFCTIAYVVYRKRKRFH